MRAGRTRRRVCRFQRGDRMVIVLLRSSDHAVSYRAEKQLEENAPVVDVVCSVLNGERFLPDFFDSLTAQSHTGWRLWLRDDGSTDGTVELFNEWAVRDSRVQVL